MSYLQEIERLADLQKQVAGGIEECIRQRDEAQEAAETYWEAWQDSCVYWKATVRGLRLELCEANDLIEYLQDKLKKEESN